MFEKILVPVDLTEKNRRAVDTARKMAVGSGGKVTLFHVIETLDLPFEELEDFYARLETRAAEGMDRLAAPLRDAGVEVVQQVNYGDRAGEIVGYAEEGEFDIVVMSSRRFDPEDRARNWATVSHKVAVMARTPILLVK